MRDSNECASAVQRWWRVHAVKDSKLGVRRVRTQLGEDIGFSRVLINAHVATVTQDAKKQESH